MDPSQPSLTGAAKKSANECWQPVLYGNRLDVFPSCPQPYVLKYGLSLNLGLAYSIAWSWPASTRAPPASASSELGLQAHSHMYLTYYISAGDQTGAIMLVQQMPNQLSHHPSSTLLTLNLIYIIIEKHMFVVP